MSTPSATRPPSLNNSTSTTTLRSALKQPSRPSTPRINSGNLAEADTFHSPQLDLSVVDPFPRTSTLQSATSTSGSRRYTPKVGFDTFQNPTSTTLFSYTLQVKSEGYKRSRSTRSYLIAASSDDSGIHALQWVMESLIQEGDEIIVFRGFDGEDTDKCMRENRREEARELMKWVLEKNDKVEPGRKLFVIVEFVGGKVTASIERLIALYRPDSLVVGTRVRTVLQQWGAAFGAPGMGSVSRYCVSRSPVPVIVVRPDQKVKKKNSKRRPNNPKRTFEGLEEPHSTTLRRPVTTQ